MYKYFYYFQIKDIPKNKRPVVLITGCSSGIGFALAELLCKTNLFRLAITAREKSLGVLQNNFTENENLMILPLDVADEKSRLELVQKIYSRWEKIDILVNNAGICYRSVIEEMQEKDEQVQLQTNYIGPVGLIRLVLPEMRKNGSGKIINISSVSGLLAMPTMGSYSASKHALEGAMEALWYEVRPFGISVSLVQPGFVRSKSHERVKYSVRSQLSNKLDRPYSDIYNHMTPFITRMMNYGLATPDSISELVYNVIKSIDPPLWIPASLDAEFFYYLKRWMPRRLLLPFIYRLLPGSDSWAIRYSRAKHKLAFWKYLKTFFSNLGGVNGKT